MARKTSPDFFKNIGTPPVTAPPITFACWFSPTAADSTTLISIYEFNSSSVPPIGYSLEINFSPQTLTAGQSDGSTRNASTAAGNYTATGAWQHAAGVFTSNASRTAYLNGAAGTANTTSTTTSFSQGALGVGGLAVLLGNTQVFDGAIAEVGIWNVALTADEIKSLAEGVPPSMVRPGSLLLYYPLLRDPGAAGWDGVGGEANVFRNATAYNLTISSGAPPTYSGGHPPVRPIWTPDLGWARKAPAGNVVFPAAAGSYAITGSAANLVATANFVLPAAAGSYGITGSAANLVATDNVVLPAAAGAYTITGAAAALFLRQTAAAGSYTLTGSAATFPVKQTAAAGAYAITGSAANFVTTDNVVFPAAAGSYSITGFSAAFIVGSNAVLTAEAGAYALTGTPAAFALALAAGAGSYSITGTPAAFPYTLALGAGSYTITGSPATLVTGEKLAALAGSYTITGSAAAFITGVTLAAAAGSYTITGAPAEFVITATGPVVLPADPGSYSITGGAAIFVILEAGSSYTGGRAGPLYRTRRLRKDKRDEIEELLELVRKDIPPELAPEPEPGEPSPPPPSLIDMAPQAPALMTAVGLKGSQRAVVKQGIVSDDEDDDEAAVTLLLELLS